METIAQNLILQLGAIGVVVVGVIWLYIEERKERKFWQQKSFEDRGEWLREKIEDREVLRSVLSVLQG